MLGLLQIIVLHYKLTVFLEDIDIIYIYNIDTAIPKLLKSFTYYLRSNIRNIVDGLVIVGVLVYRD